VGNVFVRFAYVDKRAFVEPHIALLAIFLLTVGVVSAITFNVARSRQFSDTRDLIEREIRSLPYFVRFWLTWLLPPFLTVRTGPQNGWYS